MPVARVNEIDLYYDDHGGGGDALLLINGFTDNALTWEPLLPTLTPRFRVLAFDNRGAGRSAAPPGPYTTRQMADDTAALLDRLGVARAHVLGFSMGGMIAQELALRHPAQVGRLALYATFARPRPAILDPWLTFVVQAAERALDRAAVALWWLAWLYTPAFLTDAARMEAAAAWVDPYPALAPGIAGQAAAIRTHDTLDRLAGIAVPTLVLVGAEDAVIPPYYARELAAGIAGARLRILERGGHCGLWEYQEAYAAEVLAFLAEGDDTEPAD